MANVNHRPRFSLRGLLLLVAFVAICVGALHYAAQPFSDLVSCGWLIFLLVAILGAIYRSGENRAFWVGFCVFGWPFAGYAYLIHHENEYTVVDRYIGKLHDAVASAAPVSQDEIREHYEAGGTGGRSDQGLFAIYPRREPFLHAARSLAGFAIAFLGGIIGRWFYATGDPGKRRQGDR
ncbi:MAG TPA: hypothetical protein VGN42_12195 [Pirellulales bacterium]|nr:hypothetical protein [Pirellulales bacterium]